MHRPARDSTTLLSPPMNLLALATCCGFCSVAAARGERVVLRHEPVGERQAERVLVLVDEVLSAAGLTRADLHGVAYGEGPGSFTGLRIACGVVQGMALALEIPVLGVSTLLALAEEAAAELGATQVIACLDARMGEVYYAAYRKSVSGWEEVIAPQVCPPSRVAPAPSGQWCACGSGFAVYRDALLERHRGRIANIHPQLVPSARSVLRLAAPRFARGEARNAASALPVYLRERVALKMGEQRQR